MLAWLKALSLGKKLAIGTATLFTGVAISGPPAEIDTTPPPEPEPIVEPAVIEIKTVTETEPIPYETIRQNDNSLAQGTTRTATTGIAGEKTLTYEVTYTDGLETARTLISEQITRQPTTEIILVGTFVPTPFSVTVTSVTSPVRPGNTATLVASSESGARCTIRVNYKSGPSTAQGLDPKNTNASGSVSWSWFVGTRTTAGSWPIDVRCTKDGQSASTRTHFTVL